MTAVELALAVGWVACFASAATLSAVEVSIIRVRRSRIMVAAEAGDPRAARLLALIDELPIVLNTVLLLALLSQVTTAVIGGYLAQRWFGDLGVTAATVATTMVLFLYAEAIPKTMAIRAPDRTARLATPLLAGLVAVLRPVVAALVWLADRQTPGTAPQLSPFTEAELRALAQASADAGVIDRDDATLVDRSFEFGDRRVAEVMVPRSGIALVRSTEPLVEALAVAVAAGHRRLPIGDPGLDEIIGLARFRDIVSAARRTPQAPVATVASPLLRCRPDERISDLMDRMQAAGRGLAIVADPDGRTVGLATVEDLVAELVGEIAEDEP